MIHQLNDLLDAELNSVFAYLGESTPYLDRAHAHLRKPLADMVAASHARAARLTALIESLGGVPLPRGLQPGEQHIAYLSIQFLLPKLIDAKRRDIARYQAFRSIAAGSVATEIDAIVAEQQRDLDIIIKALG